MSFKKKATINDVARLAEVSKKTVSRVINKEPKVKPETLSKVQAAIEELNYSPDPQARGLAFRRSFLLAMVYDNPNPSYVTEAMYGALSHCRANGYELIVHPCDSTQPDIHDEILNFVKRANIDGVVLLPPVSESDELVAKLRAIDCRYVRLLSVVSDDTAHMVYSNDRQGVGHVVDHLVALGHKDIGFIQGPNNSKTALERYDGFKERLESHGLDLPAHRMAVGSFTFQSGVECAEWLLNSDTPPTAIFASNDEMAFGAMVAAEKMGISIPRELAIVGFDDNPQATKIWPALTTVNLPIKEMGRLATEKLMALCEQNIDKAAEVTSELSPKFVRRHTTAPPKS